VTTIAVSWKDKSIACDLQLTHASGTVFKASSKVLELPVATSKGMFQEDRALIGFAGNADSWGDIVSWLTLYEGKPPRCKGIEMLLLTKSGIWHGTTMSNWLKINEPYFAIGSGMQYALAAMVAGKTPLESCKIASRYDKGTGLGFKTYTL
jgi:ATP-dependent protease HslVU (ClpYQ) peptidase subunit